MSDLTLTRISDELTRWKEALGFTEAAFLGVDIAAWAQGAVARTSY